MTRLSRLLARLALGLAGCGLIAMTAIIAWQVVARGLVRTAPDWTEQAALVVMLWSVLFAVAAGVREDFHVRLPLLEDSLSGSPRRALFLARHAVVALFGGAMAAGGAQLVVETAPHLIPALGVSRALAYVPVPLAGLLIAFFALEHLVAAWRGEAEGG